MNLSWCLIGLKSHIPIRCVIGGFRCLNCGRVGNSLDDFGFDGYVDTMRPTFKRQNQEVERSQ